MELILSVIAIGILAVSINFLLSKRKKNHFLLIDSLFREFENATECKNIFEIDKLGKEIIYNEGLTKIHLDYISEIVNLHFNLHPSLLELKELIMNKKLFWGGMSSY